MSRSRRSTPRSADTPSEKPRWNIANDKIARDQIPTMLKLGSMPHSPYSRFETICLLVQNEDGPPTIHTFTPATLGAYLSDHIDTFTRKGAGDGKQVETPKLITETVCKSALNSLSPDLKRLKNVVTTPVLLPDGTLLTTPGYHEGSGLYLSPTVAIPPVPERPNADEVCAAKRLLLEVVLADFEFVMRSDKANYLAYLFTPLLRAYAGGIVPLITITANNPGCGKSHLARLPGMLFGIGEIQWPTNDSSELRKAITAAFTSETAPIFLFDNIDDGTVIRSGVLARLITDFHWSDRILGYTKAVAFENNRTWVMTGNNLMLAGDNQRRTVPVRLGCSHPHPEDRDPDQFKTGGDLLEWAGDHREEILHAMLVLVADWVAAGALKGKKTLACYVPWTRTMDGFLRHIGVEGFLEGRTEAVAAQDPDGEEWAALLTAWRKRFGPAWVSVRDVLHDDELSDYLFAARGQELTTQTLGLRFRAKEGRWFGEYRLARCADKHAKQSNWRVEKCQEEAEAGQGGGSETSSESATEDREDVEREDDPGSTEPLCNSSAGSCGESAHPFSDLFSSSAERQKGTQQTPRNSPQSDLLNNGAHPSSAAGRTWPPGKKWGRRAVRIPTPEAS
ncbi:hypothetical protein ACGFYQ_27410 [Streptomyces sp. NPDC048258]|uniref:hypothetical protein n=1 Tax=Streptomyces sp. NPDC048258 TaxID=3365527 RepID=UPI00370FD772